jgi:hypothetical protein
MRDSLYILIVVIVKGKDMFLSIDGYGTILKNMFHGYISLTYSIKIVQYVMAQGEILLTILVGKIALIVKAKAI